jgi:hypothetical protein
MNALMRTSLSMIFDRKFIWKWDKSIFFGRNIGVRQNTIQEAKNNEES